MAILTDVPGLKVEVYVDGAPLKEYDDDEEEASLMTVTKYVEAISGANFEIRYWFTNPFPANYGAIVSVKLDGESVDKTIVRKEKMFQSNGHSCTGASSVVHGTQFSSKFRFSELKLEHNGSSLVNEQTRQKLASTGSISMSLFFIEGLKRIKELKDLQRGQVAGFEKVPEKALKANPISHYGSFEAAKKRKSRNYYDFEYVDGMDCPFATFNFKYRSLASLKELHIVPRTPSPVPLEERPEEELSPEELQQLVRQLKEKNAAAALKVKSEGKVQRGIKRERANGEDEDDEVSFVSAKRAKNELPRKVHEVIEID